MVAIIRSILRSVNSLIVLLITFLGFTISCAEAPEYGTPHANFIIYGKIESVTDSKPIPDIIVEMRYAPETDEDSTLSRLITTGFSNYSGSYYLNAHRYPDDQTFRLRFIDTDGPLNGEYETLDTTVVFQNPKFVNGDDSWYRGYVDKELNIQLMPKE